MELYYEDSRSQLLSKARQGAEYKGDKSKGKNRYERRTKSKISNSVREYNQLDMNKFFKEDILDLYIKVHGETDDYMVGISFSGILELIREETSKDENLQVDLRLILKMLKRAFNREDKVLIRCNCLHPSTRIKLLDGTEPTVEEMCSRCESGEQLYVYSVDEQGDFKPGVVEKVWQTGSSKKFVKVTLDNAEQILTTPEHLYMLRDGSYIAAKDLQKNMSLMPMYFDYNNNGYERVKLNSPGKRRGWYSVYQMVANYFHKDKIEEAKLRVNPDDNMAYDVAIHHQDFNKNNNTPENLLPMTAKEHWMYHAALAQKSKNLSEEGRKSLSEHMKQRNANPTEAMLKTRLDWQEKGRLRNYDEDRRHQQAEIMKKVVSEYYSDWTEEKHLRRVEALESIDFGQIISEAQKKNWDNNPQRKSMASEKFSGDNNPAKRPDVAAKISASHMGLPGTITGKKAYHKDNDIIYLGENDVVPDGYKLGSRTKSVDTKKKMSEAVTQEVLSKRRKTRWLKHANVLLSSGKELTEDIWNSTRLVSEAKYEGYFDSFESFINYLDIGHNYNHKVVSVETVTLNETPVYDIKVKDYHNFLVNDSVIVHNCPDWQYRMSYFASVNDLILGDKENRPSDITNPDDKLGPACKHVILVLSNTSWIVKLASAVNNYIHYIEDHYENAYAEIIYPQLYGREYDKDVQLSLFDKDELDNQDTDTANEYGRTRTQFKRGNQSGVQFASEEPESTKDDEQMSLDLT